MRLSLFSALRRPSVARVGHWLKRPVGTADIPLDMMISDEQVRRAVEYLRTSDEYWESAVLDPHALPEDLMRRVRALLSDMPELRLDRVDDARVFLADPLPNADELAAKVIGRILSDSIR